MAQGEAQRSTIEIAGAEIEYFERGAGEPLLYLHGGGGLGPDGGFLDIMARCRPRDLSVYGRFTRRGGIDINPFRSTGKRGVHTEHMGFLLAEMQHLQRSYPGAVW